MAQKRIRQYVGILMAIIFYYLIHEGAHLFAALLMGVFKKVRFLGLGMQIVVNTSAMTNLQLGIFCLVGTISTFIASILLVIFAPQICRRKSSLFRAIFYYITLAMLLIDPLYLSLLCNFFGGGDLNGIKLIIPEIVARIGFGVLLVNNIFLIVKRILPTYSASFREE